MEEIKVIKNKKLSFRNKIIIFGITCIMYTIMIGLAIWTWLSADPNKYPNYLVWIWIIRIIELILLIVGFGYLIEGANHLVEQKNE